MLQTAVRTHWDKVIHDLEARLAKAKAVRDALGDPELVDEIVKSMGIQPAGRPIRRRSKKRTRTHTEKVIHFFREHKNAWSNSFDIAEGTGLKREAVRQILYKSLVGKLGKRSDPQGSPRVQFRLKSSEMD